VIVRPRDLTSDCSTFSRKFQSRSFQALPAPSIARSSTYFKYPFPTSDGRGKVLGVVRPVPLHSVLQEIRDLCFDNREPWSPRLTYRVGASDTLLVNIYRSVSVRLSDQYFTMSLWWCVTCTRLSEHVILAMDLTLLVVAFVYFALHNQCTYLRMYLESR
jgi:hypothetical protein